jgi:hypothetical protein
MLAQFLMNKSLNIPLLNLNYFKNYLHCIWDLPFIVYMRVYWLIKVIVCFFKFYKFPKFDMFRDKKDNKVIDLKNQNWKY